MLESEMNISQRIGSLTGKLAALAKQSRRGAAAVEFALLVPVVVAGLTGVANYGLAVFEKIELESAARAGAQMAIRDRENTSAIQQNVVDSTNLTITTSDVSVSNTCRCADIDATATCGTTCADGDPTQYYTTVTVSKNFTLLLLGTIIPLSESVTVRTE